ncbi:hypothetical protein [Limnobacter sp.]|jgi:hypothetical protein|uniref:head-tail joining protein n=1 Tax=Limnobacter sp. TaxID=2003368 RepID=UPI0025BAB2BF|nr:hypothetical protein [Limnobacter sp.]
MALADFLTDDLDIFFDNPFGVSATSGSTTAKVLLDQPSQVLAGDMVLTTDFQITAKTSDFGTLLAGADIEVDSVDYTVRETRLIGDGLLCEISLQKT